MNKIKRISLQICLIVFFCLSVLTSVLWMSGHLENDFVGASTVQQYASAKAQLTKENDIQSDIENKDQNMDQASIRHPEQVRPGTEQNEEIAEIDRTANDPAHHLTEKKGQGQEALEERKPDALEADPPLVMLESNPSEETTEQAQGALEGAEEEIEEADEITFDIDYDLQAVETDLDLSQFEMKSVVATGYTAGFESTGKNPEHPEFGITYSGVKVRRDLYSTIAADLSVFPIGTILYIPNYGYGVVADIGGAIKGDKIDLYFNTVEDVYRLWGKKNVDVYVIQEGDGELTETLLDHLNHDEILDVYKNK